MLFLLFALTRLGNVPVVNIRFIADAAVAQFGKPKGLDMQDQVLRLERSSQQPKWRLPQEKKKKKVLVMHTADIKR